MKCTDHLGNEFRSVELMCEAYHVLPGTYYTRLCNGDTKKEALLGTNAGKGYSRGERADHLGNVFPSVTRMCEHYGVLLSTFLRREKKGYTLEQCLLGNGVSRGSSGVTCTDHLGNEYKNTAEMCRSYGVPKSRYLGRLKTGHSKEESLTNVFLDIGVGHASPCTDHLGNNFPSKTAMCKHYGVSKQLFFNRIQIGWSVEDALTTPKSTRGRKPKYGKKKTM